MLCACDVLVLLHIDSSRLSPQHEPGGDDLAGHVGQLELRGLEVRDALLELLALLQ